MLKTKEISPLVQQLLASTKGLKGNIDLPSSHGKEFQETAHARCGFDVLYGVGLMTYM